MGCKVIELLFATYEMKMDCFFHCSSQELYNVQIQSS